MVVVWNVVQCGICSLCQPLSYWLRTFTHKEWLNYWLKLLCILFLALVPRRWYRHENALDWAASHLYMILCFEFIVLCILYTHRCRDNEHRAYWITYSSKFIAVWCSCKSITLHVILIDLCMGIFKYRYDLCLQRHRPFHSPCDPLTMHMTSALHSRVWG